MLCQDLAFVAETARSSVSSPLWSIGLRDSTMSLHYTSHRSVESTKKGIVDKMFGVLSLFGGGKLLFQKLPSSRETGGDSWQGEWRHRGIYMVTRCVNHKPIPMKTELNSERKPE